MRVQIPYFSSYNMPSSCVACGNPMAPHTHSVGTSNWSGKQSVSLKFPICEECNQASKANISANRLGCLTALGAALLGGAIGAFLNPVLNASGLDFAGALVGLIAGIWLTRYLVLSRKPADVRERIAKLNKSVRMLSFKLPSLFGSKGSITLDFADAAYGTQFMALNGGKA
ncbi:MAG: hypothetical protein WEA61_02165 [Anaerolineales bacterium]